MEINSSFNSNDIEVILESSKIKKSFGNVYAVKCVEGQSDNAEIKLRETKSKGNDKCKIAKVLDHKNRVKKQKNKTNRGEKRKLSGNVECNKKIKRKKKDEKSAGNNQNEIINNVAAEVNHNKVPQCSPAARKTTTSDPADMDVGSDLETREDSTLEKLKPISSRKLKAMTTACRETLDVLMKLGSDMLGSMDKCLRILKEHNFLDNKLISVETLIELIRLALETNKASEEVVLGKEMSFSKIISNSILKTPKSSKGKGILNSASSPKIRSALQDTSLVSVPVAASAPNEGDTSNDLYIIDPSHDKSVEGIDVLMDLQENNLEQRPAKNFITNYFKKLKKIVEERDKNERFSSFSAKTDMFGAPKFGGLFTKMRREKLEEELKSQTCTDTYLIEKIQKPSENLNNEKICKKPLENSLEMNTSDSEVTENVQIDKKIISENIVSPVRESEPKTPKRVPLIRVAVSGAPSTKVEGKMKAKLYQFHDNRRPPYWGTWRRRSDSVGPRKPLAKDKAFNYEIDSDEEWEEEEEPGESLHGSEDEKEPEEDYEVDNDFFVPHGYLSDDENPEKENMPLKTKLNLLEEQLSSELNQKTRKMTPIVFGTFWVHNGTPEEGIFKDLQLEKLQYFPWTAFPIEIEKEEVRLNENTSDHEPRGHIKKVRTKVTFPDQEVPNLIKIIHGSPQNSDKLAKKFLHYWQSEKIQDGRRFSLTKRCVLKKIKELATWQASQDKKMCWMVPIETQKEFGTEIIKANELDKKPQKCYIWKFIKKDNKTTGMPSQVPSSPEVVLLD